MGFDDHQLGNLEDLIDDAESAGAFDVAERARQLREEARPGMPWGIDGAEEEYDDDDDDDWDDFADPFEVGDALGPIGELMKDLTAAIMSGKESAIEKVRETALRRGISRQEFEEMLKRVSPLLTDSFGRGNRGKSEASAGDEAQTMFDFGE